MADREYSNQTYKSWTPGFWDQASPELAALGVDPEELKKRLAAARSGAGKSPKVSDYGYSENMPDEYGFLSWLIDEYVSGEPKVKSQVSDPNAGWPEGLPPQSQMSRYMK